MASVSFFLRGTISDKESTIYIKFRDKDIDIRISLPHLTCKPVDWKNGKCKSSSKKMNVNDSETINVQLSKIEANVLSQYDSQKPQVDLKAWLKSVADPSFVAQPEYKYSDEVIEFCDVYISVKKNHVSPATIKKVNVVKNLLKRYVDYRKLKANNFRTLKFSDLSNTFRDDFISYCESEHYNISTTYRNLKFIKMIAKVAESFDVEVHKHISNWNFELDKATKSNPKSIYLTEEELNKIEQADMPHDYLDNARDWLLIACYTGQRVSDYLRFNSSMIVVDSDGTKFIEFVQQKTNARMRLPLLKKVIQILDKRDGEFPRVISDVKLNLFIKEVCQKAEISEMIYNGMVEVVTTEDGRKLRRKVFGCYPKYKLVTSHIGRKSFASNFYERVPIAHLLNFTGHTTEKQLLNYINKSDVDKAKSTAEIFSKLGY